MKNPKVIGPVTLFELLIIIAIVAVVVILVTPSIVMSDERRKTSKCQSNLLIIRASKKFWSEDWGKYDPTNRPPIDQLFNAFGEFRELPRCPSGGTYDTGTLGQNPRCSYEKTMGGRVFKHEIK